VALFFLSGVSQLVKDHAHKTFSCWTLHQSSGE